MVIKRFDSYFPLVLRVPPPPGLGIIVPLVPPTPFLAAGFFNATTLPFFRGFLWHAFTPVPIKWDFQPYRYYKLLGTYHNHNNNIMIIITLQI